MWHNLTPPQARRGLERNMDPTLGKPRIGMGLARYRVKKMDPGLTQSQKLAHEVRISQDQTT